MIQLLVGVALWLFPYFLVVLFHDRLKGLVYVSVFSLAFSVSLALITQSAHIFVYPIIIAAHALVAVVVAVIIIRDRHSIKLERPGLVILIPLLAFIVIGYELSSVHYNYTGMVDTSGGIRFVAHDSYSYPLFSDEWVNASLARYSIEHQSLPSINPLVSGESYANLLTPFDSLIAELFLLLGLDPVSSFAVLVLVFGLLMSLAIYIFMRKLGIGTTPSSIAVMFIPFLAQSGNLPGIWFLLPYNIGLLAFVFMLIGIVMRRRILIITNAALSLIFYPPMMVFVIPTLIVMLIMNRKKDSSMKSNQP
jgi:hypothetical protein